jgi:sugar/nucleoside kinase (ribokinase family)
MIRVNATGCSLVDNLYGHSDFNTDAYRRLTSRSPGDGGLSTGGLVFSEALAAFAGAGYPEVLEQLTGKAGPDSSNIGGPGVVPILHAAQVRRKPEIRYRFAGVVGRDENGRRFRSLLEKTGFPVSDYTESDLPTPSTDVLSDPTHNGGRGERTFINTIGAAGTYGPDSLPRDFFEAEVLLFGATALVPPLHDELDSLCRRGRESGAFVMVCTVYDFRNQARLRGRPWPLVEDYGNIDLLITDREEALRISGMENPQGALAWFLKRGCYAAVITQGPDEVLLGTQGKRFLPPRRRSMPTCRYADDVVASLKTKRDTTGCGDNFVGGVIDSVAHQMANRGKAGSKDPLDLEEAVISGIAAGSLALTCLGGVYYEKEQGEKLQAMQPYLEAYRRQLAGEEHNE